MTVWMRPSSSTSNTVIPLKLLVLPSLEDALADQRAAAPEPLRVRPPGPSHRGRPPAARRGPRLWPQAQAPSAPHRRADRVQGRVFGLERVLGLELELGFELGGRGRGRLDLDVQLGRRHRRGLELELELEYEVTSSFFVNGSIGYTHNFMDSDRNVSANFVRGGAPFTVVAPGMGDDIFSAGVGAVWFATDALSVGAGYRAEFSSDSDVSNSIGLGASYSF